MLLLGFGHKARHGKDLAAAAIKDYYAAQNLLFTKHGQHKAVIKLGIFKFANALYTEVNDAIEYDHGKLAEVFKRYNTPSWVVEEPNPEFSALAPFGKHPTLLQWWGTEYRRAQDPDYWVDKTFAAIPDCLDLAMITDVRFLNEVQAVEKRGGYSIKVERLDELGKPFVAPDRQATHISEIALNDYPWNFHLKIPNGHAALTCEMAITLSEYLRGLHEKRS